MESNYIIIAIIVFASFVAKKLGVLAGKEQLSELKEEITKEFDKKLDKHASNCSNVRVINTEISSLKRVIDDIKDGQQRQESKLDAILMELRNQ